MNNLYIEGPTRKAVRVALEAETAQNPLVVSVVGLGNREGFVGYALVGSDAEAFLANLGLTVGEGVKREVLDKQVNDVYASKEPGQLFYDLAAAVGTAKLPLTQMNLWAMNRPATMRL